MKHKRKNPTDDLRAEYRFDYSKAVREKYYREAMKSPAWHEGVLRKRPQNLDERKSQFIDWNLAKRTLRKKLS